MGSKLPPLNKSIASGVLFFTFVITLLINAELVVAADHELQGLPRNGRETNPRLDANLKEQCLAKNLRLNLLKKTVDNGREAVKRKNLKLFASLCLKNGGRPKNFECLSLPGLKGDRSASLSRDRLKYLEKANSVRCEKSKGTWRVFTESCPNVCSLEKNLNEWCFEGGYRGFSDDIKESEGCACSRGECYFLPDDGGAPYCMSDPPWNGQWGKDVQIKPPDKLSKLQVELEALENFGMLECK